MPDTSDNPPCDNGGKALHVPRETGIIQPISTRDLVLRVIGKVDALSGMVEVLTNQKPWFYQIFWVLAENKNGQLKFVAMIILGLAAIANGLSMAGYGVSIAGAETAEMPAEETP